MLFAEQSIIGKNKKGMAIDLTYDSLELANQFVLIILRMALLQHVE
jgi:hypothetical protein